MNRDFNSPLLIRCAPPFMNLIDFDRIDLFQALLSTMNDALAADIHLRSTLYFALRYQ
jgi:hypothetical protein